MIPDLFPKPPEWVENAACAQVSPDLFYPDKGDSVRGAKSICLDCDVRLDCLNYALETDERWGIWGGTTEVERRRMKPKAFACRDCSSTFSSRPGLIIHRRVHAPKKDAA